MGERGPTPKRSDKRLGHTSAAERDSTVTAPGAERVEMPEPDAEWHPVAQRWYVSLGLSGQSAFYEPSDWATAYAVAESMSRELEPQPLVVGTGKDATVQMHRMAPKAASVAAWLKAATALLATEGDRRRAAIELERPKPAGQEEGGGDVTHLDSVRDRLRGAS